MRPGAFGPDLVDAGPEALEHELPDAHKEVRALRGQDGLRARQCKSACGVGCRVLTGVLMIFGERITFYV